MFQLDTLHIFQLDTLHIFQLDTLHMFQLDTLHMFQLDTLHMFQLDTLHMFQLNALHTYPHTRPTPNSLVVNRKEAGMHYTVRQKVANSEGRLLKFWDDEFTKFPVDIPKYGFKGKRIRSPQYDGQTRDYCRRAQGVCTRCYSRRYGSESTVYIMNNFVTLILFN